MRIYKQTRARNWPDMGRFFGFFLALQSIHYAQYTSPGGLLAVWTQKRAKPRRYAARGALRPPVEVLGGFLAISKRPTNCAPRTPIIDRLREYQKIPLAAADRLTHRLRKSATPATYRAPFWCSS